MIFSRLFFILILLSVLVLITDGWVRRRKRKRCSRQNSCVSCTSTKSWTRSSCRWCPSDSKCHEHGALISNPCSPSTNIVNKADCKRKITSTTSTSTTTAENINYDKNVAFKMVYLSALAYASNVGNHIRKAKEVDTFILKKQITKRCKGNAFCSAFVAVSSKEKIIVLSFRGSQHPLQVIQQLSSGDKKVPFTTGGKVLKYFNDAFHPLWKNLKQEMYRQINNNPSYGIVITGHSLGGALASLASVLIAHEKPSKTNKLSLYTFGQPRTGDHKYATIHGSLVTKSFRITHFLDPVVHLPPCKKRNGKCLPGDGSYHHGTEIYYGNRVMKKSSSYKICNGAPQNEDINCSNNKNVWQQCFRVFNQCQKDHKWYFGVKVGEWWLSI